MGILDRLQKIGCNVTVYGSHGWIARLTMHHDGDCEHGGYGEAEKSEDAVRAAVHGLLKAATGSKCGEADAVAELRRIASVVG